MKKHYLQPEVEVFSIAPGGALLQASSTGESLKANDDLQTFTEDEFWD